MAAKPIPDGYPRVAPYLYVHDAAAAIDFYREVFGATERMRMPAPDDRIGHAELSLGDSVLMLADEFPDMGVRSPTSLGGAGSTGMSVMVYVEDVDAAVERAVARGATVVRPVEDKFYGDRAGQIDDPFGHRWDVCTHIEDLTPEEMTARMGQLPG